MSRTDVWRHSEKDIELVEKYKSIAKDLLDNPDNAQALVEQHALVYQRMDPAGSLAHLALAKRALAINDNFVTRFNYGAALFRQSRTEEALNVFKSCMALAPAEGKAEVHAHIGLSLQELCRFDEAIEYADRAIALQPGNSSFHFDRAVAQLSSGFLHEGLMNYEHRHRRESPKPIADSNIPVWAGEDLTGKTLIVSHEQGYGDGIQFMRFLPDLQKLAAKVIYSGPAELTCLVDENFPGVETVGEHPPFKGDYRTAAMSALAHLGYEYAQISGKPYLKATPAWLPRRAKKQIGIVWRGSRLPDARRSMSLADLVPLFEVPGVAFYSFQIPASKEVGDMGLDGFLLNLEHLLKDWSATARYLKALDGLIAIDTGTVHLAGALGVPTCMMATYSTCWRWPRKFNKSPWYDSVEIMRQKKQNDWTYPIAKAKEWIEKLN